MLPCSARFAASNVYNAGLLLVLIGIIALPVCHFCALRRAFQRDTAPLAGAEFPDQHFGGTLGVNLAAGNQHTALGTDGLQKVIWRQSQSLLIQLVALHQALRIDGPHAGQQTTGKLLDIQDIIFDGTDERQIGGGFQTVNVNPDSPGGMGAPYLFASGNTDLAFINGAPAKWAMEEGTLGKPATSGYAAVIGGLTAVCYINCVSNAFLQKYNVSTIEEIFEQKLPLRIGCSAKGSMDAEGAYLLLEYFGVTEDDLKSWGGSITNQGGDANADAISDGQIDFYIDHTSSASSTMAQIATSVDVTFLQWGDDLCSWFVSEKGFDLITIPANSFKGQDKELTLPGTPDCVFCKESLSEDVVYAITKSLSENRDALVAEYNSLSPWEPETAWEEMKRGGCPLHPGAEKYYKEAGYMK